MSNVIQFPSSLDRANRALCLVLERFNASDDASVDHSAALAEIMRCAVSGGEAEAKIRAATWLLRTMNVRVSA